MYLVTVRWPGLCPLVCRWVRLGYWFTECIVVLVEYLVSKVGELVEVVDGIIEEAVPPLS